MKLEKIVEDVGRAVAQVEFGQWGFAVSQIDLTIKTVDQIENGIKVGIGAVELGANLKAGQSRTVTLSLVPRPALRSMKEESLLRALVNGIREAAEGLRISGDMLPEYGLESATVEVGFAVDKSGAFKVGLTGAAASSHGHTVKLTLVSRESRERGTALG
jgi:hypothetical protein